MAEGSRTAVLLGASGLVGGHCLDLLLAEPAYSRVVAMVRRRTILILRPSLLLGGRPAPRPGEGLATRVMVPLNPLLVGPLRKYRAISAAAVARAMVALAKHGLHGFHVLESDQIQRVANGGASFH